MDPQSPTIPVPIGVLPGATALLAGDDTWRAVLDQIPAGVVVADPSGAIVYSNPAVARLIGQVPGPPDAAPAGIVVGPDGLVADGPLPLARALGGEHVVDEELVLVRPDGTRRELQVDAAPLRDVDGRLMGAVSVVQDRSEERRIRRNLAVLAAIGEILELDESLEALLERMARATVPEFADGAAVLLGDGGGNLERVTLVHRDAYMERSLRDVFLDDVGTRPGSPRRRRVIPAGEHRFNRVLRGEPLLTAIGTDHPLDHLPADQREAVLEHGTRDVLAVPVAGRSGVHGVFTFAHQQAWGRTFVADDVAFAVEIGRRCGLLVEQLRQRAAVERAERQATALQKLAAALSRAVTTDDVLEVIVRDGADLTGASFVSVLVISDRGGGLRLLPGVTVDSDVASRWRGVRLDDDVPLANVLRTGVTEVLASPAAIAARYPSEADDASATGTAAVATVPLRHDGTVLGAVAFSFGDERALDSRTVALVHTATDLAAHALGRAQRFDEEHRLTLEVQLSLLPSALEQGDTWSAAARYSAPTGVALVGGDWFDVHAAGDDVVVVIGDVAGNGVQASKIMAKVRHAVGAASVEGRPPSELLRVADQYLARFGASFVTCLAARLDPRTGKGTVAVAGHLPPIVVGPDGAQVVYVPVDPPLGAATGYAYREHDIVVPVPGLVLLYTDGLVERRGECLDVGLQRVADVLTRHADDPPDAVVAQVLGGMRDTIGKDDAALLALRLHGSPVERFLRVVPAEAGALGGLRSQLRRWLEERDVDDDGRERVVTAVNELVANAIVHAHAPATLDVVLEGPAGAHRPGSPASRGAHLDVTVTDRGGWIERDATHDGRGLAIVDALAEQVWIDRTVRGTSVTCRFEGLFGHADAGEAQPARSPGRAAS